MTTSIAIAQKVYASWVYKASLVVGGRESDSQRMKRFVMHWTSAVRNSSNIEFNSISSKSIQSPYEMESFSRQWSSGETSAFPAYVSARPIFLSLLGGDADCAANNFRVSAGPYVPSRLFGDCLIEVVDELCPNLSDSYGWSSFSDLTTFLREAHEMAFFLGVYDLEVGKAQRGFSIINSNLSIFRSDELLFLGHALLRLSNNLLAVRCWKLAAELGNHKAKYLLSTLEFLEFEERVSWLKEASDSGHHFSSWKLAVESYEDGNREEALGVLRHIAECGFLPAVYSTAIYSLEIGDLRSARDFMTRAAELGHVTAGYKLRFLPTGE